MEVVRNSVPNTIDCKVVDSSHIFCDLNPICIVPSALATISNFVSLSNALEIFSLLTGKLKTEENALNI